jgi:hypothetical protein
VTLKRAGRVCLIIVLVPISVMVFTLAEASTKIPETVKVQVFDTAGWVNTQMPGRLLIRRAASGENMLLTMRDEFEKGGRHRAVYEYEPGAKSLRKIPNQNWDAAASPISECFSPSRSFPEKFKVSGEKLFSGNREVTVKGAVLLSVSHSPSGNTVAILSADGPRKGSLMPFLGGGSSSKGQHYHQLFSVAHGEPVGAAFKLPFTTEKQAYLACWSVDEKYVIYTSLLADKLTIVETGLSNPDTSLK